MYIVDVWDCIYYFPNDLKPVRILFVSVYVWKDSNWYTCYASKVSRYKKNIPIYLKVNIVSIHFFFKLFDELQSKILKACYDVIEGDDVTDQHLRTGENILLLQFLYDTFCYNMKIFLFLHQHNSIFSLKLFDYLFQIV